MSATMKPVSKSKKDYCGLQRPRYSAGLLLRDDDLGLAVDYTRDLSRLLFRSLVGCGVVCGLGVKAVEKCGKLLVSVAKGVALDCCGNPIHVCGDLEIAQPLDCGEPPPECFWVLLRYVEKCCAPRTAMCASEEDEAATSSVCTRAMDGYEVMVTSNRPECVCGCIPPADAGGRFFDCYKGQKAGECETCADGGPSSGTGGGCGCGCDDCACEWVVLARVCSIKDAKYDDKLGGIEWKVEHKYRRYVRPRLAPDPLLATAGSFVTRDFVDVTFSLFDRKDFRDAFNEQMADRMRAIEAREARAEAASKQKPRAKKK